MYHCIFPHLVQTSASTLGVAELCIFQNLLRGFPSKFKQMLNIERVAASSKLSSLNKQQLAEKSGAVVSRHPQTTEREGRERVTGGLMRHRATDGGRKREKKTERANRWPWCENKPDKKSRRAASTGLWWSPRMPVNPKQVKHHFFWFRSGKNQMVQFVQVGWKK